MNINTLRKNYDKLTVKERFAALVAASARGDDQETDALLQSAPDRIWRVPHTYGLAHDFIHLVHYHMIRQLEFVGLFMWLAIASDEAFPDELYTLMDRFTAKEAAFAELCKEYGLDPEAMYKGYETARELILMTSAVITSGTEPAEPPDIGPELEDMRQALKDWA